MDGNKHIVVIPATRLVPADDVTIDDFLTWTDNCNWIFERRTPRTQDTPEEHIFCTPDSKSQIHWIEDPRTGVSYIAISGENQEVVAQQVRRGIPTYDIEKIRRRVTEAMSRAERMRALYQLSLVAPDECDPEILDIFSRYLTDPDPGIRLATVIAISYMGWREFRALLHQRATSDADETVRKDAATLLENMDKYPPRSVVNTSR